MLVDGSQLRRQSRPLSTRLLRPDQGLRFRHTWSDRGHGAYRPSFSAGAHGERARRTYQNQSGQVQLRIARQRYAAPFGGRAVPAFPEAGSPARPLQRRRAGDRRDFAGHTPISFGSTAPAVPLVRDGKLRALAVSTKNRSQALPDIPTMAEAGYSDVQGESLVCGGRAGRHPKRDHRAAPPRHSKDHGPAGHERTARYAGLRAGCEYTGRVCSADEERNGAMDESHSGRRHQSAMRRWRSLWRDSRSLGNAARKVRCLGLRVCCLVRP